MEGNNLAKGGRSVREEPLPQEPAKLSGKRLPRGKKKKGEGVAEAVHSVSSEDSQSESMLTAPCIQSKSNFLALSQAKNSKTLHPDKEHKPSLPDSIARPITNMPLSRMENITFVKPSIIDFHDMGLRTVLTVRTPKEQRLFQ
ncbi:hypothetical protein TNCV_731091 [Trichonephila clavipes]|nr:hypothetical protein TNCV_731091 [Trichonephila clavipes]